MILEGIARNGAESAVARIAAIRTHNEMTGEDKPKPEPNSGLLDGHRVGSMTREQLIEAANRNLMAMLPSGPKIVDVEAEP